MDRVSGFATDNSDYADDIVAWSGTQVALLRAGRIDDVDIEHIIEEIESLGASQRAAIASQIDRIIEHLLKLIYSPAIDPRRGWRESVRNARRATQRLLKQSPSLLRETPMLVEAAFPEIAHGTADTLLDYGELSPERDRDLRAHRLTPDQVLGDWFPDA